MTLAERYPGRKKLSLFVAQDIHRHAKMLAIKDKTTFTGWLQEVLEKEVERRQEEIVVR